MSTIYHDPIADEALKRLTLARKIAKTEPLLSAVLRIQAWEMLRQDTERRLALALALPGT